MKKWYEKLKRRKAQGKRRLRKPELSIAEILAWADAYHQRNGKWPKRNSGPVRGTLHETWSAVDSALKNGARSLRTGSSLARLLAERRGVRSIGYLPPLSEKQIVAWADAHYRRTGAWPSCVDGAIADAPGETWVNVDALLRLGGRTLPGGSSLPRLLERRRGVRNRSELPRLTIGRILSWADAHFRRTGAYPACTRGAIEESPGESWHNIDAILRQGGRGLPGGSSLPQLLHRRRGVPLRLEQPALTEKQILAWADAFHRRTGFWPSVGCALLSAGQHLQWITLEACLREGRRGLPGGSSLAQLLAERRGVAHASREKLYAARTES